tara:strand:- start:1036 stop:1236 length:201 start_codon:yes stop_codon:yes gene_type:complete
MKDYFKNLLLGQILNSKKFWYAISSVIVPLLVSKLGVSEDTATDLFWALLTLTGAQGIADIGKHKK